jgi:hypothetical protein
VKEQLVIQFVIAAKHPAVHMVPLKKEATYMYTDKNYPQKNIDKKLKARKSYYYFRETWCDDMHNYIDRSATGLQAV